MTFTYLQRTLGLLGTLAAIGACGSDHRIGTGTDPINGGKGGSAGSAGGSSGGMAGSAGSGGSSSDPCAGKTFPACAPQCPGGFQIAGTPCTAGEACTISNFGDECACTNGTWLCSIHPPLGPGCNKVCEYAAGSTKWWETCGDPVCRSPDPDDPSIPNCTTENAGVACSTPNVVCELPGDTCGAKLLCTDSDPKARGCPKSQAAYKDDIRYLDERELERVRDELLRMKLAHWYYKSEPHAARSHLGFIIDDQPDSPAVMANGERVDLYGYVSMAAATIQLQQKQLDAMERELRLLRDAVSDRCGTGQRR
jgi:hypothetical protein